MNKVLIIDDSDFDRKMIKMALSSKCANLQFIELPAGHKVLEVLSEETPQVAIVDIRMPGMDGFDVLKAIRSQSYGETLPVLIVSGSDEPEDRNAAERKGASGYFVKPPSAAAYFSMGRDIYNQYLSCA